MTNDSIESPPTRRSRIESRARVRNAAASEAGWSLSLSLSLSLFARVASRARFCRRLEPDAAPREKPCKRAAPRRVAPRPRRGRAAVGREVTGGRLHHDIRHSSPPPSFVTLPPPSLSPSLCLFVRADCASRSLLALRRSFLRFPSRCLSKCQSCYRLPERRP